MGALEPTDREMSAHWMPFTATASSSAPAHVRRRRGRVLHRRRRQEASSTASRACGAAGLGHGRREIVEAVQKQVATLDYAPAFQFGHPRTVRAREQDQRAHARRPRLRVLRGSGSEAADTSLKMARAYWRAKGQGTATRLIGREKGYHGVNFGGISVGGIGRQPQDVRLRQLAAGPPAAHPHPRSETAFTQGRARRGRCSSPTSCERLIALHDASNIAAVIVEPMRARPASSRRRWATSSASARSARSTTSCSSSTRSSPASAAWARTPAPRRSA